MKVDFGMTGKVVLVTGGAGSVGSALVKKILEYNPKNIRILDNNESAMFWLKSRLNDDRLRFFYGDVRDYERLEHAIENVDIVVHAAAMKHVSISEHNAFDAVKTNILGTQNTIKAAMKANVEKFLLISTDKAVNANSVMGATKMLAERLTISANNYKGDRRTVFSCVRFGNVIGSSGSVAPLFEEQIKNGGPLTITDSSMTRFIMPIEKSTDLILKALHMSRTGEIFILKMPAIKLSDLAESMIELSGKNILIKEIGSLPGEKIHEELMTEHESKNALETSEMFILPYNSENVIYDGAVPASVKYYRSYDCPCLGKDDIKTLLKINYFEGKNSSG